MNTNVNANTIPTQIKYEIKIYKDISCTPSLLAMSDTQIDLIQCLNFAQNWFNSIFNSKSFQENSIQKIIKI